MTNRTEAFAAFRDALRPHFIPDATLVKAFNSAWLAGEYAGAPVANGLPEVAERIEPLLRAAAGDDEFERDWIEELCLRSANSLRAALANDIDHSGAAS